MQPQAFYKQVMDLAQKCAFPTQRLMLGGDHLGPNPWRQLNAQMAMQEADAMVRAYVAAGYKKIHLDASMSCQDDVSPLSPETIAERNAVLCKAAEETLALMDSTEPCVYVIGTEVPTPGGIREAEEMHITKAEDAAAVLEMHKQAFMQKGLADAWQRVVALVVQPGVEFGDDTIIRYEPEHATTLREYLQRRVEDAIVYEAHSTDYQTASALRELVHDHFAILKVGPQLTFAMREALFALAHIEARLHARKAFPKYSNFINSVVSHIQANPTHWKDYYSGDAPEVNYAIQFSLSDRMRYYWNEPAIQEVTTRLINNLGSAHVPPALISQYLPHYPLEKPFDAAYAIQGTITRVLSDYNYAVTQ